MNRIRVQIVDDEPKAQYVLEELLKEHKDIDIVARSSTVESALDDYQRTDPEILFLDIKLKSKSGFDLLDRLEDEASIPQVIFTTGYDQYAIQAIKKSAFDYLMKPIHRKDLSDTLERFRNLKPQKVDGSLEGKKLRINTRTGYLLLDPNEILYLKSDGNYTRVVVGEDNEELCTKNLGSLQSLLPDFMIRLSRSIIINKDLIYSIDRKQRTITLRKDGISFPVTVRAQAIKQLNMIT